jgi:hypothetical protein
MALRSVLAKHYIRKGVEKILTPFVQILVTGECNARGKIRKMQVKAKAVFYAHS